MSIGNHGLRRLADIFLNNLKFSLSFIRSSHDYFEVFHFLLAKCKSLLRTIRISRQHLRNGLSQWLEMAILVCNTYEIYFLVSNRSIIHRISNISKRIWSIFSLHWREILLIDYICTCQVRKRFFFDLYRFLI